MKPKRSDLKCIYEGKHNIWTLDCVSCNDPMRFHRDGYFDNLYKYLNSGDVIIAFGDTHTHIYTLTKENIIIPSSLVAFQGYDLLPKKTKGTF